MKKNMKKRLLSMLLTFMMVICMMPVGVLAAENTDNSENTKPLYLSSLQYKTHASGKVALAAGTTEYTISCRANSTNLQIMPALSQDAPEGSTITAKYVNTDGEEKQVNLPVGTATSLSGALAKSVNASTVTITAGVEGDVQEVILKVERLMTNPTVTVADPDGAALSMFESSYRVPDGTDTVMVTAESYGAPVTINGGAAESGKPQELKVVYDANNEFKINVVATYMEQEYTVSVSLKPFESYSGTCNDNINWVLDTKGTLTIS